MEPGFSDVVCIFVIASPYRECEKLYVSAPKEHLSLDKSPPVVLRRSCQLWRIDVVRSRCGASVFEGRLMRSS